MRTASRPLDWLLVPYAHRPPAKTLKAFEQILQDAFGDEHKDPAFLSTLLRDTNARDRLRTCYRPIWSNHNLVSMALYSGPLRSDRWSNDSMCSVAGYQWESRTIRYQPIGWLGTGDMHLDVARRRDAFLAHYRAMLDQVNVFGLPHHGADQNFDSSLPLALPSARQFVAAAGPNGYGHPGKATAQAIKACGRVFVTVSEHASSGLEWRHSFP
jgi:hypothetical protein